MAKKKASKSLGFEGMVAVAVKDFTREGTEADKNGHYPVILQVFAGKAPNRIVISGTVAINGGLIPGKSYIAQCREQEYNEEYGRQFIWTALSEMSVMDILTAPKALGKPFVFSADEDNNDTPAQAGVVKAEKVGANPDL
jgi:hypothetical protein